MLSHRSAFHLHLQDSAVKIFSSPVSPRRPEPEKSGNEINRKNDVLYTRHRTSIKFLDGFSTLMWRADFVYGAV